MFCPVTDYQYTIVEPAFTVTCISCVDYVDIPLLCSLTLDIPAALSLYAARFISYLVHCKLI